MESVFTSSLLMYNANATNDLVDEEVARRWIETRFPGAGKATSMVQSETRKLDDAIFLGASSQLKAHL